MNIKIKPDFKKMLKKVQFPGVHIGIAITSGGATAQSEDEYLIPLIK